MSKHNNNYYKKKEERRAMDTNNQKKIDDLNMQIAYLKDKIQNSLNDADKGLYSDKINELRKQIKEIEYPESSEKKIVQIIDAPPIADRICEDNSVTSSSKSGRTYFNIQL